MRRTNAQSRAREAGASRAGQVEAGAPGWPLGDAAKHVTTAAGLADETRMNDPRPHDMRSGLALAVILAVALGVRLWELERRGFCHPENFVSGIAVPDWVHHPPQRLTLDDIVRTTPKDGHPPFYFLALHPWIKAFGTSLFSLRLPSALLGTASVLLLWMLARRECGRGTALLAAALLALSGFHAFWSQMARMYALATFLILLSTWLLIRVVEDGGRRWRVAYTLTTVAALWTHVYCWPMLLGQIIWSTARAIARRERALALPAQLTALIVSFPVIALAVHQSPKTEWAEPMLEFFEFGYLFNSGSFRFGEAPTPPIPHLALLALGLGFTVAGMLARPKPQRPITPLTDAPPSSRGIRWAMTGLGAVVASLIVAAAFSWFTAGQKRRLVCLAISALPLATALAFPLVDRLIQSAASSAPGGMRALAARLSRVTPILTLTPIACLGIVSLGRAAFTARGMLVAVPFLTLLCAQAVELRLPRLVRWGILAPLLLALHATSTLWFQKNEASPRDYAGFAHALEHRLEPTDRIFVGNNYADPPLLYYLPTRHGQFVPAESASAIASAPNARVWVILYEDQVLTPEMTQVLAGRARGDTVQAFGCRADLYAPRR